MKLQLKRSLKTLTDNITAQAPTVDQMEYGELAINYATTDATIFLKDSNNVIQKLQVSAVPDVPAGETLDDRYVSLSGSTLTGNLTAPSFIGGVARTSIGAPTTGQNGELWWNTFNGRLYIYDGDNSSWVDASPDSFTLGAGYYDKDESDSRYVAKAGSTMTGPLLLSGNPGGEALAATPKQYVDGQVTGLDTTLRTYIDAQIATRAATTYVNTQLSLKADTTYVTSAITTSETAAATAYVSKSGDVISGDLTANAFIGDGSQLTGVGSETIISNTPPTPANYEVGTMWWNSDSTDTSLYILYQDPIGPNGDPGGKYWIEASPAPDSIGFSGTHTGDSTFTGNMSVTGNGTFTGNVAIGEDSGATLEVYQYDGSLNNNGIQLLSNNFSSVLTVQNKTLVPTTTDVFKILRGTAITAAIKTDGSAEFAGKVDSGNLSTGPGCRFNPTGNIEVRNDASGKQPMLNALKGGTGAGDSVAAIYNDGSATFAGHAVFGGALFVNAEKSVSPTGATSVVSDHGGFVGIRATSGNTTNDAVFTGGYIGDGDTSQIFSDGTATFAGGVFANYFNALTDSGSYNFYRSKGAAGDLNSVWGVESGTQTIQFYNNGSATFAGPVTSNRTDGQHGAFYATLNGGTTAYIQADGSATFTGANGESRVFGVKRRNNSNSSLYGFEIDGNGSTTIGSGNITLDYSGSATFAGTVDVNSNALLQDGARIVSYGVIQVRKDAGLNRCIEVYKGGNLLSNITANINNDGSARFNGNVSIKTSTGTSTTIFLSNDGSASFIGNITAGNVSDIKFKENIEAAPAQLADIEAFELKTFTWKDEAPLSDELKAQRKLGLIAQEVEAICPEMVYEVTGQDDESYKAINHDVLIMKLLGAVKELAAEVAALKAS